MSKNIYEDEKNIHDGHRARLIATVDKVGLESLSKVQAMEYILFFIFPRGDVNPLAHRLLERFHNIPTILEASVEDIQEVRGMGPNFAKKLHSLLEIFYFYTMERIDSANIYLTNGEFYDYIETLMRFKNEEELYLFGVNIDGRVIKGRRFSKGNLDLVSVQLRDISLYISTHKVKKVYLVHNHPEGSCKSSQQDSIAFNQLKSVFNFSGCILADSLIVGKDGIYSMEQDRILRIFNVGIEYRQLIGTENRQTMNTESI